MPVVVPREHSRGTYSRGSTTGADEPSHYLQGIHDLSSKSHFSLSSHFTLFSESTPFIEFTILTELTLYQISHFAVNSRIQRSWILHSDADRLRRRIYWKFQTMDFHAINPFISQLDHGGSEYIIIFAILLMVFE